ncbi:MAG: hypothetical protein AAGE89_04710 [Pseudomonadota bacterium]
MALDPVFIATVAVLGPATLIAVFYFRHQAARIDAYRAAQKKERKADAQMAREQVAKADLAANMADIEAIAKKVLSEETLTFADEFGFLADRMDQAEKRLTVMDQMVPPAVAERLAELENEVERLRTLLQRTEALENEVERLRTQLQKTEEIVQSVAKASAVTRSKAASLVVPRDTKGKLRPASRKVSRYKKARSQSGTDEGVAEEAAQEAQPASEATEDQV